MSPQLELAAIEALAARPMRFLDLANGLPGRWERYSILDNAVHWATPAWAFMQTGVGPWNRITEAAELQPFGVAVARSL